MVDYLSVIIGAAVTVVSVLPLYADWINRRRKSRPVFHLERFAENIESGPVPSSLTLRVKCVGGNVEKCEVHVDHNIIPFVDRAGGASFERAYLAGDSENYRIPNKLNPNKEAPVVIKTDSKVLKSCKWDEVIWSTP